MNQATKDSIICANPKCNKNGFVACGQKWFCGECIIKVISIIHKKDEEYLMRELEKCL